MANQQARTYLKRDSHVVLAICVVLEQVGEGLGDVAEHLRMRQPLSKSDREWHRDCLDI